MSSISSLTQSLRDIHLSMQRPHNKLGTLARHECPLPSQDKWAVLDTYADIIISLYKETIPASDFENDTTSNLKKLLSLIRQIASLSQSRLECLSLPPYDLPPKPLYRLLQTHSSSLDRLKEEYAITIQSHAPRDHIPHLIGAYDLLELPLLSDKCYTPDETLHRPLKMRRFFHAHACGRQIHDVKKLGKGGFGEVNQATLDGMSFASKTSCVDYQKHLERHKANNKDPLSEKTFLKCAEVSFSVETALLMKLHHPNIIKLFAARASSKPDEMPVLFLELASETLCEFFENNDIGAGSFLKIDQKKHLKIFSQIASALDHMHGKGVIHNDLTQSNVLLTKSGNVKITDFGLAIVRGKSFSRTGVYYISPPECLDSHVVSDKRDIWAFGVLLYRSFTNFCPYPKIGVIEKGIIREETNQEYRQRLHDTFYKKTVKADDLFKHSEWKTRDPSGFWRTLIGDCLNPLPEKRPSASKIYKYLSLETSI